MRDTTRRDRVLGEAIAAGKFGEHRRTFWTEQYDANPSQTEAVLAAMVSVQPEPPYPQELFPELARRQQRPGRSRAAATPAPPAPAPGHVRQSAPLPPAASGGVSDEQIAAWSRSLFPETASASGARVSSDMRYGRSA
jgi:hypothetical protein